MGSALNDGLEPIAIVGMGCRLPGDVKSPMDLWNLLMARKIAHSSKVPSSRFNVDAYLHRNNERPGSFNVPGGHFLEENPEDFDPTLFDMSPVEAAWMDPQQRKLLEVVYEALESSGTTLEQVAADIVGCFVGSSNNDFQQMALKEPDFRHSCATTGTDPSILANRISHVFNLRGPSYLINTSCSSSMFALHNACNAIRNGDCDAAVVGGTNLILTVDQHMNTAKLGVLSATNTCRSFDDSADGYSRAEGIGALYLKPLDKALRDNDPIRAIIRSTATNSNGRTENGITHPSMHGQVDAISTAYELANLNPALTTYVECHGIGTRVGDPIEVNAVHLAMRSGTGASEPILVGSSKPNTGHSEGASSIATIIKAVLAVETGIIPPTAGLHVRNKKVKWNELDVDIVTTPTPFPATLPVRRVGVNVFGYGGTNGHAIIDNVEALLPEYNGHKSVYLPDSMTNGFHEDVHDSPHLLVFSAHNKATLKRNLTAHSEVGAKADPLDLAYTLGLRRTRHSTRTFAICRKHSFVADIAKASENISEPSEPVKVAFAFTGQGAEWPQMGVKLFHRYPSFLRTIRELDVYLSRLPDPPTWTIENALQDAAPSSRANEAEYSQPLCTAIQIALVILLHSWGVVPVATIGHSSGELAAAYASGQISAEDAIIAAYYCGKVSNEVIAAGAMLTIGIGAPEASLLIEKYQGRVVVACHNSPGSSTISGDVEIIEKLKSEMEAANIFAQILKTDGKAYHSHHMKDAARSYEGLLNSNKHRSKSIVLYRPRKITMISSVTGTPMEDHPVDHAYWRKNLTDPVLFSQALHKMVSNNPAINVIIEVGPHSTLSGPIRQTCNEIESANISYLPTLQRDEHDGDQLLKLVGSLWVRDSPVDIGSVTKAQEVRLDGSIIERTGSLLVDLPPYQWTYTKDLSLEPRPSREQRSQKHPRHDVLGRRVLGLSDNDVMWRNVLRHKDLPWLKHHSFGGQTTFPASGYIAMAIEALTQLNSDSPSPQDISGYTLRNISISSTMAIPDNDEGVETLLGLRASKIQSDLVEDHGLKHWYQFTVSSFSQGEWTENAIGSVGINIRSRGRKHLPIPDLPLHATSQSWNNRLRDLGIDFGSAFQCMTDIQHDGKTNEATADIAIKQSSGMMTGESRYALHPACIDSCLQLFIVSINAGNLGNVACGTVVSHLDEVTIWPPTAHQISNPHARLHSWTPKLGNQASTSNAQLIASNGELLADFVNVRCRSYEASVTQKSQTAARQDLYMQLEWKADIDYLEAPREVDISSKPSVTRLVDLLIHKDASLSILCLDTRLARELLEINSSLNMTVAAESEIAVQDLQVKHNRRHIIKFSKTDITAAEVVQENEDQANYDLIIASDQWGRDGQILRNINHLLRPRGRLLLVDAIGEERKWRDSLSVAGFSGVDHIFHDFQSRSFNLLTAATMKDTTNPAIASISSVKCKVLLVYRHIQAPLIPSLAGLWAKKGWSVRSSSIHDIKHEPTELVIMLADLEGPLLATLKENELRSLQYLIGSTSSLIWVTPGGCLAGGTPEYGMVSGFSRVVKNEKRNLDLVTLDYDPVTTSDAKLMKLLGDIINRQVRLGKNGETEYCIDRGVVHIGRLTSNKTVNEKFADGQGNHKYISVKEQTRLNGVLDSGRIEFKEARLTDANLDSHDVELKVMATGLSRDDSGVICGTDDANAFLHEVAGIVVHTGSEVSHLKVGDRVVGFSSGTFDSHQRIRANLLRHIPGDATLQTMASLPKAFATALYGLEQLASIDEEEVALIIDGSGPAGLAALQICELLKAQAIVVTSSEATISFLHKSGFPLERIVVPGHEDVIVQIRRATAGRDIDVVFCHNSADQFIMHECFSVTAPLGRVVVYGARDRSSNSLSDILKSTRGSSAFTFDIRDLYTQKPKLLSKLLDRTMQLFEDKKITAFGSLAVSGLSELNERMHSLSNELGAEKAIVSYEVDSTLKVLPTRPKLDLCPDVTYLLVGCLGGLGQTLASWMVERGARRLAFMSRSGTDSPQAAALVDSLRALGISAQVLRADATSKGQVQECLKEIDPRYPVRGVINAVAVLQYGLFHNMNIKGWSNVINTKLKTSINLHEALLDQELDFFVMTSAVTATIGSEGQSNYGAANSFLDAFAHHRRMRGLPAVSLVLPMILGIGYIADQPEMEASIRDKGMYGIDANEMLASFEVAMLQQQQRNSSQRARFDHLIVGMEPSQLAKGVSFTDADTFWLDEPRLRTVKAMIEPHLGDRKRGTMSSGDGILTVIKAAKTAEADAVAAVTEYLAQRLSRLLMLQPEDFFTEKKRSVASYGLDSIMGAEFRNWVFKEFKVDLPFRELLAKNATVTKLATDLCVKLGKGKVGGGSGAAGGNGKQRSRTASLESRASSSGWASVVAVSVD